MFPWKFDAKEGPMIPRRSEIQMTSLKILGSHKVSHGKGILATGAALINEWRDLNFASIRGMGVTAMICRQGTRVKEKAYTIHQSIG